MIAIKKTIAKIEQEFEITNDIPKDIFILTDSLSALDAMLLKTSKVNHQNRLKICCKFATMQVIVMESTPPYNGSQDTAGFMATRKQTHLPLAKLGSNMPQKDETVSYSTAKSLAKEYSKTSWKNSWIQNDKGRALFKYQSAPNPKDAINQLERKHQCTVGHRAFLSDIRL